MTLLLKRLTTQILAISLLLSTTLFSSVSYAGFSSTESAIEASQHQYEKAELLAALSSDELQSQLIEMGVDPQQVEDRVASMTSAEVEQLNLELAELPAGAGIGSVLLTLFIVFIITDMLCATDVFGFVNCIN